MLRRRPPRPRGRSVAAARRLSRHSDTARREPVLREKPAALPMGTAQGSHLDRPLYCLLNASGALCAGRVSQGDCILLFTSQDAAAAFAEFGGVASPPPRVFSRSRSEFLTQAGRSLGQGFIGGLIDMTPDARRTQFVGFHVDRQQGGPESAPPR